jgi:hypothetical protein
MKRFFVRKGGPTRINDSECLRGQLEDKRYHHEPTYHDHGYLAV